MNKFVASLIAFYFVFGVVGYSVLHDYANFTYTDEITVSLLFCIALFPRRRRINVRDTRNMFMVIGIFTFYLFYSLKIGSNTRNAILMDFLIQIKPYIAFYSTLIIAPNLTRERKFLKFIVLCAVPLLLVDPFISPVGDYFRILGHATFYSSSAIIIAFVYLYSKPRLTSVNLMVFCMLLSLSLFSLRVKALVFWGVTVFLVVLIPGFRLKMSLKNGLLFVMMLSLAIALGYQKVQRYWDASYDLNQMPARMALYQGTIVLLKEHVPFGSGYASYATFTSGQFYSKTYYDLEFFRVQGLTPDKPIYVSDTYFPALAEFGVAGICLFAWFWLGILRTANRYRRQLGSPVVLKYTLFLLMVVFLMLQSVAASTLTHNAGVFLMILLAVCLTDLRREYESAMTGPMKSVSVKKEVFVHPGFSQGE